MCTSRHRAASSHITKFNLTLNLYWWCISFRTAIYIYMYVCTTLQRRNHTLCGSSLHACKLLNPLTKCQSSNTYFLLNQRCLLHHIPFIFSYFNWLFFTDTHTVTERHNIELECEAVGPTPPLIHWLFNGHHINQVSPQYKFGLQCGSISGILFFNTFWFTTVSAHIMVWWVIPSIYSMSS